ncbi:hypothetical protein [Streptomyces bluensis]|uniref:Uncharacterized protein n=1 Tax=Streptomyces bluensis TaxID=33897 RepID=A0ABW6UJE2_9ACTN
MGTAAPFFPRLGDLARDGSRNAIGVVTEMPGEGRNTYHLSPPGGGTPWSVPNDGATLRPVAPEVTAVTPQKRDVLYDHRAGQAALPVIVHHEDGTTTESLLVLDPAQLEQLHQQAGRALERRDRLTVDKGPADSEYER